MIFDTRALAGWLGFAEPSPRIHGATVTHAYFDEHEKVFVAHRQPKHAAPPPNDAMTLIPAANPNTAVWDRFTHAEWRDLNGLPRPAHAQIRAVWEAGDPCGACGSADTGWNLVDGGYCRSCGRSDADE